jgi:hypothetical protein
MLTGVWTVSSAKRKEGWLSEEACRVGVSTACCVGVSGFTVKSTGILIALALLIGLEKLKAGRGNRVPPTEISELMEGDLGICCCTCPMLGDVGDVDIPLLEDSFLWLSQWGDNT